MGKKGNNEDKRKKVSPNAMNKIITHFLTNSNNESNNEDEDEDVDDKMHEAASLPI